MTNDPEASRHQIVIVRRRGGDDSAAGKAGAWKIAYADFVTAMMAFFLVMWLINASNEETRAQVASYFNPIKLTDSSTGKRGVKDKKNAKNTPDGEADDSARGTPPSATDVRHESELMANPDKTLDRIEAGMQAATVAEGEAHGISASDATRGAMQLVIPGGGDPFDPKSWEKVGKTEVGVPGIPAESTHSGDAEISMEAKSASSTAGGSTVPATKDDEVDSSGTRTDAQSSEAAARDPSELPLADGNSATERETATILLEITAAVGAKEKELVDSLEIKATQEGLLINLTDRQSFGMFLTGSAEPEPGLVKLVSVIAASLKTRPGYLVIRGHTDSRPYRNKKYDNWQLSTARAHLVQYMLIRGGVDEGRIRRVEGLADREPLLPGDPQAPENRRVEILLGSTAPK
jgi:chemotaxis protein MotB